VDEQLAALIHTEVSGSLLQQGTSPDVWGFVTQIEQMSQQEQLLALRDPPGREFSSHA